MTRRTRKIVTIAFLGISPEFPLAFILWKLAPSFPPTTKICKVVNNLPIFLTLDGKPGVEDAAFLVGSEECSVQLRDETKGGTDDSA